MQGILFIQHNRYDAYGKKENAQRRSGVLYNNDNNDLFCVKDCTRLYIVPRDDKACGVIRIIYFMGRLIGKYIRRLSILPLSVK
jgi:hypothetical protein